MYHFQVAGWTVPEPVISVGLIALAILLALAAHGIFVRLLLRLTRNTSFVADDVLFRRSLRPMRWIFVAISLALIRSALSLDAAADAIWKQAAGLIVPLLIGWLAISLIRASTKIVEIRSDITVEDNLKARRRRTRSMILGRIATIIVAFITICLMLLSIPGVRSVGVTLMASAGLVGLAVGAAAQPALKNLIAGVQMAFTEPIRIDDAVIIADEWGWVEEIKLTYVVIKIWDQRRLIVPVSKFLDEPFQNWTRDGAGLLGSVFLYLDPSADIARLRDHFEEVVVKEPLFDGRGKVLQVTDANASAIEIRMLATASNSPRTFDLRCAIREKMLAFIRDEMPEAFPRTRAELGSAEWKDAPGRIPDPVHPPQRAPYPEGIGGPEGEE
ncbi:mechanosensitive ion channel family protein [Stakelama sp. CBK3Z-3]|uniref:Mechanosensitive ion channel family protein n=1 Tax=Stakelama flava TaxID=2860338 RepID=A0ABS6XL39_9SPHN|nr:mechanosensitive ion channel family protein [Stakelama flava]MBW4330911.1 mechanosensitive ion channel family protein [Stakelama flava]